MFSFILLSPLPLLLSFSLFLFPSLLPRFSHLRLTSPLASPPFILIFISLNRLRRRFTNLETFVPLLRFPLFINLSGGDRGFSLFPSLSSVASIVIRLAYRKSNDNLPLYVSRFANSVKRFFFTYRRSPFSGSQEREKKERIGQEPLVPFSALFAPRSSPFPPA